MQVSRGSTFAITMVYGLTELVGALGTAAELSGHTRRVAALLRGLQYAEQRMGQGRRVEAAARRRPAEGEGEGEAPLLEARRLRAHILRAYSATLAAGKPARSTLAVPASSAHSHELCSFAQSTSSQKHIDGLMLYL